MRWQLCVVASVGVVVQNAHGSVRVVHTCLLLPPRPTQHVHTGLLLASEEGESNSDALLKRRVPLVSIAAFSWLITIKQHVASLLSFF